MRTCERQASGAIELYFYDELEPGERADLSRHLRSCLECRQALEELSLIRSALASRPVVDAPPGGDWSAFMERLDDAVGFEQGVGRLSRAGDIAPAAEVPTRQIRTNYAAYLAMAALLTLVTAGVVYVAQSSSRTVPALGKPVADFGELPGPNPTAFVTQANDRSTEAAFAAVSEQHFERSKLVVLGLANKNARRAEEADWAYERGLASDLLSDTRLYKIEAEQRGMKTLAGVMGDLELVLLQTSLADAPDAAALEQIQRLIHKRDLVTKMDAAATVTTGS